MQVILIQDVPNLGKAGELKTVKPGFARHYLIPQGWAVLPNDPVAKETMKEKIAHRQQEETKKSEQEKRAQSIVGKKYTFRVKVDKNNNPYGSIGPKEIAAAVGVDENLINTHFKKLGIFPLKIDFGKGIMGEIQVEIKKEL